MTDNRTEEVLRAAGWWPGRQEPRVEEWDRVLQVGGGFTMHPAARSFLQEFGGLSWADAEQRRPTQPVFDLDPTLAIGEDDRFAEAGDDLGQDLYPVGEALGGSQFVAVARSGGLYLVMDQAHLLAPTAWEAFGRLVEHG